MLIQPDFGTKQGLIDAVAKGEAVLVMDRNYSPFIDGVTIVESNDWYATVVIKNGQVVKVT